MLPHSWLTLNVSSENGDFANALVAKQVASASLLVFAQVE